MNQSVEALPAIIDRLSKIPSFHVMTVDEKDGTKLLPWYQVTGAITVDLVVTDANLGQMIQASPGQIMHWGRIVAVAKRVWQIQEREYRQWRDRLQIKYSTAPEGKEGEKWKKPSEETIAAMIRTSDGYREHQVHIEKAEEAFNAATVALEAFKAQSQLLRSSVYRAGDQNPSLAV